MMRSIPIVTLLSIAAQVVGFFRLAIIAAFFGTSIEIDAYNLGLIPPTFLATVAGSWLQVAFVGRYLALLSRSDSKAASFRSLMLAPVATIACVIALVCTLAPIPIVESFVHTSDAGARALTVHALAVAGWLVVPTILSDFAGLILNCHGRFFAAAFGPVVNTIISTMILWLWPTHDLSTLIGTLLVGAIAQLLIAGFALANLHLDYPIRNAVAASKEVGEAILLGLPIVLAMILSNLTSPIIQSRNSEFGPGTVAVFGYAWRLYSAMSQVLIIGFSTVLLPHFAALLAKDARKQILNVLRRIARVGLFVSLYLVGGIFLLREPALNILFARGKFDVNAVREVGFAWFILSLALFPQAFGTFIAKFCQASQQAMAILISGLISFAATWTVTQIGVRTHNFDLVASSLFFSSLSVTVFWLFWLAKRMPVSLIVSDIIGASAIALVCLAPGALACKLALSYDVDLTSLSLLIVGGASYSLVAAGIALTCKFHHWLLDPSVSGGEGET
jgi:putative peptidoglycan lipid II flippase